MKRILIAYMYVLVVAIASAKVTLPAYFTDNMVLQQQTKVTFHGKATPGKLLKLTAEWNHEIYQTQVGTNGRWKLEVYTPKAGGPYAITITDGKKLQLKNVMVGEVWFCSGQSNMEMPLAGWGKVENYEQEVAEANYPYIRLFQVKKNTSLIPLDDVEANNAGWQECTPATVANFSSVAYFYARTLWKELGIPVGVIDCTWGGTPAEAWTSCEALKKVLGFQEAAIKLDQFGTDRNRMEQMYEEERADWISLFSKEDKGMKEGIPCWVSSTYSDADWKSMTLPGFWEGKGLEDFNGVVWFRRTLQIPEKWSGKSLTLRLGMIDDEDITYFNGVEIARGSGFMTPRTYVVPAELVKEGQAVLTIRVSDFGGEGGIHGKADELYVEADGNRIDLTGDWKYCIGLSLRGFPQAPVSPTQSSGYPAVLFNAMVHPFLTFPIKGVIWYQGEANEGRAAQYGDLFPALIADWRKQWEYDFPFYFVQLANYKERKTVQPESDWAFLREAQAKALHLFRTGMAVAIDIGEAGDIHPKNKQEVGRRLALLSLAQTYGKPVSCSAPAFKNYIIRNNEVEISFEGLEKTLCSKDDILKGFTIAGSDRVFYPAQGRIVGDKVLVTSPEVDVPLAVRYAWADNPECNLYGGNGLPVAPFRTDNW